MRNIGKHGKKPDKNLLSEITDNFRSMTGKKAVSVSNKQTEHSEHEKEKLNTASELQVANVSSSDLNENNDFVSDNVSNTESDYSVSENSDYDDYKDEFSRDYYSHISESEQDFKADEDAVVLDKLKAQELLLTHAGRYMDIDVPGDWFPLPLFWYRVDQY